MKKKLNKINLIKPVTSGIVAKYHNNSTTEPADSASIQSFRRNTYNYCICDVFLAPPITKSLLQYALITAGFVCAKKMHRLTFRSSSFRDPMVNEL